MRVFVSWSGDRSRDLARVICDWLPFVVPNLKPWMSEDDIPKGLPWRESLFSELTSTTQGIVCITPDNVNEPWLNFEAGSLAKAVQDKAYVWTLLLDIQKTEVTGPLASFQATTVHERDDFWKLVRFLNEVASDPHKTERLERLFNRFWPDLVEKVAAISRPQSILETPKRNDRELLEEILSLVRSLPQNWPAPVISAVDSARFPRVSALPEAESPRDFDQGLG